MSFLLSALMTPTILLPSALLLTIFLLIFLCQQLYKLLTFTLIFLFSQSEISFSQFEGFIKKLNKTSLNLLVCKIYYHCRLFIQKHHTRTVSIPPPDWSTKLRLPPDTPVFTKHIIFLRHSTSSFNKIKRENQKLSPIGRFIQKLKRAFQEITILPTNSTILLDPPLCHRGVYQALKFQQFLTTFLSPEDKSLYGAPLPLQEIKTKTQLDFTELFARRLPKYLARHRLDIKSPEQLRTIDLLNGSTVGTAQLPTSEDEGIATVENPSSSTSTSNVPSLNNNNNNHGDNNNNTDEKPPASTLLVTSSHRRAMSTMALALKHRLARNPQEKIYIHSGLASFSPTPAHSIPHLEGFDANHLSEIIKRSDFYQPESLFNSDFNYGAAPLTEPGVNSIVGFTEWIAQRPEENIVICGHSSWLLYFFRSFLPKSQAHVGKVQKLKNTCVISFDLKVAAIPQQQYDSITKRNKVKWLAKQEKEKEKQRTSHQQQQQQPQQQPSTLSPEPQSSTETNNNNTNNNNDCTHSPSPPTRLVQWVDGDSIQLIYKGFDMNKYYQFQEQQNPVKPSETSLQNVPLSSSSSDKPIILPPTLPSTVIDSSPNEHRGDILRAMSTSEQITPQDSILIPHHNDDEKQYKLFSGDTATANCQNLQEYYHNDPDQLNNDRISDDDCDDDGPCSLTNYTHPSLSSTPPLSSNIESLISSIFEGYEQAIGTKPTLLPIPIPMVSFSNTSVDQHQRNHNNNNTIASIKNNNNNHNNNNVSSPTSLSTSNIFPTSSLRKPLHPDVLSFSQHSPDSSNCGGSSSHDDDDDYDGDIDDDDNDADDDDDDAEHHNKNYTTSTHHHIHTHSTPQLTTTTPQQTSNVPPNCFLAHESDGDADSSSCRTSLSHHALTQSSSQSNYTSSDIDSCNDEHHIKLDYPSIYQDNKPCSTSSNQHHNQPLISVNDNDHFYLPMIKSSSNTFDPSRLRDDANENITVVPSQIDNNTIEDDLDDIDEGLYQEQLLGLVTPTTATQTLSSSPGDITFTIPVENGIQPQTTPQQSEQQQQPQPQPQRQQSSSSSSPPPLSTTPTAQSTSNINPSINHSRRNKSFSLHSSPSQQFHK